MQCGGRSLNNYKIGTARTKQRVHHEYLNIVGNFQAQNIPLHRRANRKTNGHTKGTERRKMLKMKIVLSCRLFVIPWGKQCRKTENWTDRAAYNLLDIKKSVFIDLE